MLATLHNIKNVSVQIKDIKKMIHSQDPRLISLYAKYSRLRMKNSYNDEDYITISKTKEMNKSLMYSLINADWLINSEDLKHKSREEIEQECIELEHKISSLKDSQKEKRVSNNIDNKIIAI